MKIYLHEQRETDIWWIDNYELVSTIDQCDAVLITGGADVNPKLYGEPMHPTTSPSDYRDALDWPVLVEGAKKGKMLLGICRGLQLITVFCGGKLIQDVNRHEGILHAVYLKNYNKTIMMPSYHHQMCYPYPSKDKGWKFDVVGVSKPDLATYHLMGDDTDVTNQLPKIWIEGQQCIEEPEIIEFRKDGIKALAWQFHPEWSYSQYGLDLLNKMLTEFAENKTDKLTFKKETVNV